jgi:hypothetical protein
MTVNVNMPPVLVTTFMRWEEPLVGEGTGVKVILVVPPIARFLSPIDTSEAS